MYTFQSRGMTVKSFRQFMKEAMTAYGNPSGFPSGPQGEPDIFPKPIKPFGKPKPPVDLPGELGLTKWTDPETGIEYWVRELDGQMYILVQPHGWIPLNDPRSPVYTGPGKEPEPEKLPDEKPTITPETEPETPENGPNQLNPDDDKPKEQRPTITPNMNPGTDPGPDELIKDPSKIDDLVNDPETWPDGVFPEDYNKDGVINIDDWLYAWANADYIREFGIDADDPEPSLENILRDHPPGYPDMEPAPDSERNPGLPGYDPYYGPGGKVYHYNPEDGTWIPKPPLPPLG